MLRRNFLQSALGGVGLVAGVATMSNSAQKMYFEYRDSLPEADVFFARFQPKGWKHLQSQLKSPGTHWHRRFCTLFGPENLNALTGEALSPSLHKVAFKTKVPTENFHKFMREFNEAQA